MEHPFSAAAIIIGGSILAVSLSYAIPHYIALLPTSAVGYAFRLARRFQVSTASVIFHYFVLLLTLKTQGIEKLRGMHKALLRLGASQALYMQMYAIMEALGRKNKAVEI